MTLITPQDAFALIIQHVRAPGSVTLALDESLGSILAETIRADRDSPPADRAAMDGYAVRAADLKPRRGQSYPCSLRLLGEVAAGSRPKVSIKTGTCARIFTGANVPRGADTVVPVEETEALEGSSLEIGDRVRFQPSVKPFAHIRKKSEEARKGKILLQKGMALGPMQIGICAAVGKRRVKVIRRPRVVVLCTGTELRGVGQTVQAHQLRNSNGPMLRAALGEWGFGRVHYRIVPDDPTLLAAKLKRAAATYDAMLLTGGVSMGKYDFVREATERIGAKVRFHKVAQKPGKPLLYATLKGNRHLFGLPGNPISAAVCFFEYALPALRLLAGIPCRKARPTLTVRLASAVRSKGDVQRYVLARRDNAESVEPVSSRGSADIPATAVADGVLVIPAGRREWPAGQRVEFHPWRR